MKIIYSPSARKTIYGDTAKIKDSFTIGLMKIHKKYFNNGNTDNVILMLVDQGYIPFDIRAGISGLCQGRKLEINRLDFSGPFSMGKSINSVITFAKYDISSFTKGLEFQYITHNVSKDISLYLSAIKRLVAETNKKIKSFIEKYDNCFFVFSRKTSESFVNLRQELNKGLNIEGVKYDYMRISNDYSYNTSILLNYNEHLAHIYESNSLIMSNAGVRYSYYEFNFTSPEHFKLLYEDQRLPWFAESINLFNLNNGFLDFLQTQNLEKYAMVDKLKTSKNKNELVLDTEIDLLFASYKQMLKI